MWGKLNRGCLGAARSGRCSIYTSLTTDAAEKLSLTLGLVSHHNGILDILPTCTFLMVLSLAESATNRANALAKGRETQATCFGNNFVLALVQFPGQDISSSFRV
jgi:hypothetical protein